MTTVETAASRWFFCPRPAPYAGTRLFCLPHAGGGASSFRAWAAALGDDVEVRAVALPGREARIAEPPEIDIAAVATALRTQLDRPYAIYGHSMGARIGFELIRTLRRTGAPLPFAFVVAANRAPDQIDSHLGGISERPDEELLARLIALGGVPEHVVAEPELVELLLPIFRADFSWLDAYRFVEEEPLPVPIFGFAGVDDVAVAPAEMLGWTRHTTAGFRLTTLPGGHFFPAEQLPWLARALRAHLSVAGAALPGRGQPAPESARATSPASMIELDHDEVHVWYADLDGMPELARATAELPAAGRDRAGPQLTPIDRDRAIARSVLLRRLLARYGCSPEGITRPAGPRDAPENSSNAALSVDISHHAGAVLIAVARQAVIGTGIGNYEESGPALRARTAEQAVSKATRTGSVTAPLRVVHLPLPGAIGAVASSRSSWRLQFATLCTGDLG